MTVVRPVVVCSIVAVALTASVWLADSFLAPMLFSSVWRWPRNAAAPIAFGFIVPLIVAVPAGYSFGLLPWRRVLPPALTVASIPAGLELIALLAAGGLIGPRSWVFWLEAVALLVAFCGAAVVASRVAARWPPVRRTRAGVTGFTTTVLAVGGLAYLGYRSFVA